MLEVSRLSKKHGGNPVLSDLTFSLARGESLAVIGPSGCGKTTLIRLLCGLDHADHGTISWAGVDISSRPPHLREMSISFQSAALWPHMTLRGNLEAVTPTRDSALVNQILQDLELLDCADRRPGQVSGGQAKRASLGRALAAQRPILLLDEPFAHLGDDLAARAASVINDWTGRNQTTLVWTSHSTAAVPLKFDRSLELFLSS